MPVKIPVYCNRIGIIQQCTPTEDRDVNFPLKSTRKRLETGTLQHHGTHIRVVFVKIDSDFNEFVLCLVEIRLRRIRSLRRE